MLVKHKTVYWLGLQRHFQTEQYKAYKVQFEWEMIERFFLQIIFFCKTLIPGAKGVEQCLCTFRTQALIVICYFLKSL